MADKRNYSDGETKENGMEGIQTYWYSGGERRIFDIGKRLEESN
jgi:hypothetical protein